jgi:NADPH:quinone reductase-like Zn-dependent oxidoreductase
LKLRSVHLYPLADAALAQSDLEARKTTGKILLEP